jgi:hypothetical protein
MASFDSTRVRPHAELFWVAAVYLILGTIRAGAMRRYLQGSSFDKLRFWYANVVCNFYHPSISLDSKFLADIFLFGRAWHFSQPSSILYSAHCYTRVHPLLLSDLFDRQNWTSTTLIRLQRYSFLSSELMASTIALGIGIATAAFLVSNPAATKYNPIASFDTPTNIASWRRVEQVS